MFFLKNIFYAILPRDYSNDRNSLKDKEAILIEFEKDEEPIEKNHVYTLKDFIIIKTLGKGSFGKVLLVKDKLKNKSSFYYKFRICF